jgi:hypothetical protein
MPWTRVKTRHAKGWVRQFDALWSNVYTFLQPAHFVVAGCAQMTQGRGLVVVGVDVSVIVRVQDPSLIFAAGKKGGVWGFEVTKSKVSK